MVPKLLHAAHFKPALQNIICQQQTAFLKYGFIGENIRNVLDVIDYTSDEGLSGFMFSVNFEKSFDKHERDSINKSLRHFQFGESEMGKKSFVRALVHVYRTTAATYFPFQRGVRQGCPLSPYLSFLY